jgi:hypothetical protein
MSCLAVRYWILVRQVTGPRHIVFGCVVRELVSVGCWVTSICVCLCGTGAWLNRLLGHVMLCLAVRYCSPFRHVSGPCHVVFGFAILEIG